MVVGIIHGGSIALAEIGHRELSWVAQSAAVQECQNNHYFAITANLDIISTFTFGGLTIAQRFKFESLRTIKLLIYKIGGLNMSTTATNIYKREISYDLPPEVPNRYLLGGTPIFTSFGCALLERQTAKSYVYSAINLSTGKSEALCRKVRPLEKSAHADMTVKIRDSSVAGASYLNIDQPPHEKVPHKKMTEITDIIFKEILPQYGYVVRENQIGLTEHILNTISHRAISLAESEVGTGKTMAYLVAAVLAKRGRLNDFWLCGHYPKQSYAETAYMPVVIATSSIALQRAIIEDYIPQLSDILIAHGVIRTPLTSVIRKGKEHFLCEKRIQSLYRDADEKTKAVLHPLLAFDVSCDIADTEGLTPYMKRKICVSGGCREICHHSANCRYQNYMQTTNDPRVDFLICNHNYYLADVLHRAEGKRQLLPHYQLVVLDEAHKFLDAARQMYGVNLDETEITQLADNIHSFTEGKSHSGVNIHRLAKKLTEQGKRLFRCLRDNLPATEDDESDRLPANMNADTTRHLKSIAGIATDLIAALDDSHVQSRFREQKAQVIWKLKNLKDRSIELQKHMNLVCWLEQPNEEELTLSSIPKNLDARLYQDIWSKGLPIILTSGTLSSKGQSQSDSDFSRVKQSLGLSHMRDSLVMETSMPSPFNFAKDAMIYISDNVPFPNQQNKSYLLAVADEIQHLITASHGHAAVLFTSYNAMGQVFAVLKERGLPFPMFQMGRRDPGALDSFRISGNGILFASGSFWEGIDIPGDLLSMLIIVKLPFAVPDPIGDYEKTMYPDMGAYKTQVLVPDMLVKLKQGFGRLIRSESDTGVVALLDSRASKGAPYHSQVLSALPNCNVTSDITAVKKFIKRKKSPEYFM